MEYTWYESALLTKENLRSRRRDRSLVLWHWPDDRSGDLSIRRTHLSDRMNCFRPKKLRLKGENEHFLAILEFSWPLGQVGHTPLEGLCFRHAHAGEGNHDKFHSSKSLSAFQWAMLTHTEYTVLIYPRGMWLLIAFRLCISFLKIMFLWRCYGDYCNNSRLISSFSFSGYDADWVATRDMWLFSFCKLGLKASQLFGVKIQFDRRMGFHITDYGSGSGSWLVVVGRWYLGGQVHL